ncbi:phytochelatin synthase family protein [Altericista sp. CCNU0014]|uniref:phytochelatin synthase family protein n=1 Tax=Altericista sp. CCNU0014 TaxID=3082949 RepID=UPI00384B71EB
MQSIESPGFNPLLWAFGLTLTLTNAAAVAQTLPLPQTLMPLTSLQGEQLLRQSQAQDDFLALSAQFVTQENQAFCGIASAVMVLNALGVPAPFAVEWKRNYFTQDNLFDAQTEAVIPRQKIERQGLTLAQLAAILERYSAKAKIQYGGDLSLDAFRSTVSQNLKQSGNFVLVNYSRRTLGQEGGGHISPVAAYNADNDRFLILDVSRYKYPSVWVKAKDLWEATRTLDPVSQKTRGTILVSALAGSFKKY